MITTNILRLILVLFFVGQINASRLDYLFPYNNPSFSDYGTLGLIQMPNSRFLEEGSLGFVWSRNEPYMRGGIVAYPFNWFEIIYFKFIFIFMNEKTTQFRFMFSAA